MGPTALHGQLRVFLWHGDQLRVTQAAILCVRVVKSSPYFVSISMNRVGTVAILGCVFSACRQTPSSGHGRLDSGSRMESFLIYTHVPEGRLLPM